MSIVYLDTETTGLDPNVHSIWEVAWATESGKIRSATIPHTIISASSEALRINEYYDRKGFEYDGFLAAKQEQALYDELYDNTLCAANPAFDASFLQARWGSRPWKYRLFDIEAYAMGALGYNIPQGLKTITTDLRVLGFDIPEPDHSAAGDVATLRACHLALATLHSQQKSPTT